MKIDRKYLPSKKFSIVIILAMIIFIAIAILLYKKENVSIYKSTLITENVSTSTQTENKIDSDNDGLEDWQEMLYSTNPNKPDTDNDGTNDSQEIKNSRNPLKANTSKDPQNPNDLTEAITIEKYRNVTEEKNIISYRDTLNQKINFQIEKEGGTTNDITSLVSKAVVQNIPKIQYNAVTKASDLVLVEANEENIMSYIKFYSLESQNISLFFEKDIGIITTDKIDTEEFNKLIKLLSLIKNTFKSAHLPKDSDWGLEYHLKIIQDFEKMSLAINDIKKSRNTDSVLYYSSLESYNSIRADLTSVLIVLDKMFNISR